MPVPSGRHALALTVILAHALAPLACAASPGEAEAAGDPSSTAEATAAGADEAAAAPRVCVPGARRCADEGTLLTCDDAGAAEVASACPAESRCLDDACLDPCALIERAPTSEGCAFWARPESYLETTSPGGIVVANAGEAAATVELRRRPRGRRDEALAGGPIVLAPGETHAFLVEVHDLADPSINFTGDTFRVLSDRPIVAYQHSPLGSDYDNDASMLLPDHTLGTAYVAASYPAAVGASYFRVIAAEDHTTVRWTPPVDTAGNNLPIPFVAAGDTGSIVLHRGDTLRIGASGLFQPDPARRDVSGAVIDADRPIWVLGGSPCAQVPFGVPACDHLEEVLLPLATWGRRYVAAHAPQRGDEDHRWRIYAGEGGVTVASDPPLPGLPHTFDARGEFLELTVAADVDLVLGGDGPFLPVHYLAGQGAGAGSGDPAMVQMVPVEQFRGRYVFATASGYEVELVQIVAHAGAPAVRLDGVPVAPSRSVGDFTIAEVALGPGGHVAESPGPFGIIGVGYSPYTSYAYPGGMQLRTAPTR